MNDTTGAADRDPEQADVAQQIGRSLGSIWERRDGCRPSSIETQFEGDAVRCVIHPGEAEEAEAGEEAAETPSGAAIGPSAYRNAAMETVSRLTHRRVTGMIAKTDSKTGLARETFTLERPRRRY